MRGPAVLPLGFGCGAIAGRLTSAGRRLTRAGHFAAGAGASSSSAAAALRFLSAAAMAVGNIEMARGEEILSRSHLDPAVAVNAEA